jgi:hypothetical protein
MPKRSYPLEPLVRVRKLRLDAAERALADAAAARSTAEQARAGADRANEAHRHATSIVTEAERAALSRGELSAGDLARADAWSRAQDAEGGRLADAVARACATEERARSVEAQARAALASHAADVRVVDEHAARWRDGERARADRAEEDEAAEAWRPRR